MTVSGMCLAFFAFLLTYPPFNLLERRWDTPNYSQLTNISGWSSNPMSALLTLFYSTLYRPLDPTSPQDLERLSSVSSMMRKIPVRRLTRNETNQI